MNIQYATPRLVVEREMPQSTSLADILMDGGLSTMTQEALWVAAYDSLMQIRTIVEVARGGYHNLQVSIPAVMTAVLLAGTDRFVIAHNHSSLDVTPTTIDVDMTRKIMAAANICGLYFEDHLIVAPNGAVFSFADEGLLIPSKDLETLAKTNKRRKRAA